MFDNNRMFLGTMIGTLIGGSLPMVLGMMLQLLGAALGLSLLELWGTVLLIGLWVFVPVGGIAGAFLGCIFAGSAVRSM